MMMGRNGTAGGSRRDYLSGGLMGTTRHSLDDDMLGGGPSFNTDRYTSSVYDRCVYVLYTLHKNVYTVLAVHCAHF